MAWLRVSLDAKTEQTEQRLNDDGSAVITCLLNYIAETDTMTTSTADALSASAGGTSIPAIGGNYTIGGIGAWKCTRRLPRRGEAPTLFRVECEFTRKLSAGPPKDSGATRWSADIQFGGIRFTQEAYVDKDDKPIVNGAKKPFDPSLSRTYYDEKIDVSYQSFSDWTAAFAAVRGYVNSDTVTLLVKGVNRTFRPRQLLLDDAAINSSPATQDGTQVWTVKATLIARKDTFVMHVLNRGYGYLDGSGKYQVAKGKDNQPVSEPINLDANGARLGDNVPPQTLDFSVEYEAPFAPLFVGLL